MCLPLFFLLIHLLLFSLSWYWLFFARSWIWSFKHCQALTPCWRARYTEPALYTHTQIHSLTGHITVIPIKPTSLRSNTVDSSEPFDFPAEWQTVPGVHWTEVIIIAWCSMEKQNIILQQWGTCCGSRLRLTLLCVCLCFKRFDPS